MSDNPLTVSNGQVVRLEYTLRLDDGDIVDSSVGREPLEFLSGQGQIIPGLEKALQGMSVGEERKVTVAPDEGYGEVDPDAFEEVSPDNFPKEVELEPGMSVQVSDAGGEVFEAYVAELHPDGVLLDFNHPLAGETLHFEVKVVGLRPATAEEQAHGHVHGSDHHH